MSECFKSNYKIIKAMEGRGVDKQDLILFNQESGEQHYRLLSQLACHFAGQTIIDIGTHRGMSAFALSIVDRAGTTPGKNKIISVDIVGNVSAEMQKLLQSRNVVLSLDNLMLPETRASARWKAILLGSAFIFLDINSPDGAMQYDFYLFLRDNGYQGFVVCKHIWYSDGMRNNFWYKIPASDKQDITGMGHWSGTGILFPGNCPVFSRGVENFS